MSVCHVTSVHSRYDGRILKRECVSLKENGYKVSLIVNDKFEDEVFNGIKIISTKYEAKNRLKRLLYSQYHIKKKIREIDADIYHLHDPELLLLVPFLKRRKKLVIFDSHEDYYSTIGEKDWIPKFLRQIILFGYKKYETFCIKQCAGSIVCYHWTEERFLKRSKNVMMVLNFPKVIDDQFITPTFQNRTIGFAGGVNSSWCHHEIIKAIGYCSNVKYLLAGPVEEKYFESLKKINGWPFVNYLGIVSFNEVFSKIYAESDIGIVLLDYILQCKGNTGNLANTKLFEVMYAGLPVICTDFDLWKEIIENENCGICVNPHNIEQIVSAITYLLDNPEIAKQMGENGRNAVLKKYNWGTEEKKLLALYDRVRNQTS